MMVGLLLTLMLNGALISAPATDTALVTKVSIDTGMVSLVAVAPAESLRVVSRGHGDPVVLLPGLFGSAYGYRHLMKSLAADGRRAIVIEPLGVGGSSRPKDADYSLAAQAERIRAVLDTLNIPSVVVVAHSLSGSIALRLACRHPNRVQAVVSIEGGAAETAMRPGLKKFMGLANVLKFIGGTEVLRTIIVKEMRAASADPSWIVEEVVAGYTQDATADVGATIDALQGMAKATEPDRLADHLSEIRAPVLLLLGDAPHGSAPDAAELALLEERVATLIIERVANAGHFIHEEQPEAVFAAVSRMLPSATVDDATTGAGHRPVSEANGSETTESGNIT